MKVNAYFVNTNLCELKRRNSVKKRFESKSASSHKLSIETLMVYVKQAVPKK